MKKKIKIELSQLKEAFDIHSDEITYYLNSETGNIAMYSNLSCGFDEDGNEIFDNDLFRDKKYIEIPGTFSYEAFRDIDRFIETIKNNKIKKELLTYQKTKPAIPHFKNVLSYYPEERNRWMEFKEKQILHRIQKWLDENNMELDE